MELAGPPSSKLSQEAVSELLEDILASGEAKQDLATHLRSLQCFSADGLGENPVAAFSTSWALKLSCTCSPLPFYQI